MALPVGDKSYSEKQILNEVFDGNALKVSGGVGGGGSTTTGTGPVDATTLRVELSDESKAAAGGGNLGTGPDTGAGRVALSTEDRAHLLFSKNTGAVDATTMRVELSDESKAAVGGGTLGAGPDTAGGRVTFSDEDRALVTTSKGAGPLDATTQRTVLEDAQAAHLKVLTDLDKNTGGVSINTLRVKLSDEDAALLGAATPTVNPVVKSDVTSSATSAVLIAANLNRKETIITNNADTNLHISYGAAADVQDASIATGDIWIVDNFNGVVHGIWEGPTPTGIARIVEVSA